MSIRADGAAVPLALTSLSGHDWIPSGIPAAIPDRLPCDC